MTRNLLAVLVLAACTVDHSGLIGSDAGAADARIALDVFTRTDAGGGPDSGNDAFTPDTGIPNDAGFDAGNDAGFDAGNDAGFDAGNDAGFDAGFDAGPPDPCTVGPDSDGDGVRDNCDECPGYDDANDADSDGVADGCDDWSCGAARPSVPETVRREAIVISSVNIHGGGNVAVVRPEETFDILFDWQIGNEGCSGCIRQVEWGFTGVGRLGCVYDANPPPGGTSGSATIPNIPIGPMTMGVFELRFNLGQQNFCDEITTWHDAEPSSEQTIGYVCVPPAGIEYPGG